MLLIFINLFFSPLSMCCNFNSTSLKLHKTKKNSQMRIMYHCNETVKEYFFQVSSAPYFGLMGRREDEAAATNSLSSFNLVHEKGKQSLDADLKEDASSLAPTGEGTPIFLEGTILRQWYYRCLAKNMLRSTGVLMR